MQNVMKCCHEISIYLLICLHQKHVANSQLLNPSISIILAKYIKHNEKVLKVTFRILQRSDGIADLHDSVFSMSDFMNSFSIYKYIYILLNLRSN